MTTPAKSTLIFEPGTLRHFVGKLLQGHPSCTFAQILDTARGSDEFAETTEREMRYALGWMSCHELLQAQTIEGQPGNKKCWSISPSGLRIWAREHSEQSAPVAPVARGLVPSVPEHLLTTSRTRSSAGNTAGLPMVHRPGSLDANALPRIHGNRRIWPDGRSEPI